MNKINTALLALALIAMLCGTASAIYEWEQVNEEGFGDLTNDYAWAMHEYNGYLYVGTLNTNISDPPNLVTDGLEIYRSPTGNLSSWEQVVGPTGTQFPAAGFGAVCYGARGMEVHDGLLWVGTMSYIGCQIWVTNGTHWKRANIPGFGNATNVSTRGITVFNGDIYAEAQNAEEGVIVWKYTGSTNFDLINPFLPFQWVQVNKPGFGEPDINIGVGELIPFDGYLYAGTWTWTGPQLIGKILSGDLTSLAGCQVWRTDGTVDPSDPPKLVWEKVMDGGFGDFQNGAILSSAVFDGKLYMGTQNFADQAELWRTSDGTNWKPVTTTGFLESGGLGTGYMWRMIVYNNALFVGTLNPILGGQVWRSATGSPRTFEQVNVNGMNGERKIPAFNFGSGFTIYGIDQYGVRSFAVFNDSLYLGTASWGDWVDRIAGTDYSEYVGCEVWRTDGTTYIPPKVYVNKTVWDPGNHEWVHEVDATLDDTVRFRCEIQNIGSCNLTGIIVYDFLSCSLNYTDEATIEPDEIIDCPIGTKLLWNLSDTTLESGESVVIEYNADVVKCNCVDKNFLFVVGYCENTCHCGYGWDIAIINGVCPPLSLSKTDDVVFGCVDVDGTITYTICYDNLQNPDAAVHNVTITDTLPAGVNFVSASHGGTHAAGVVTWNIGTVQAEAPETCVTLNVTVNAGTEGQTLTNCAVIESDETEPRTACEETDVCEGEPTPTPTPYPKPIKPASVPVPAFTPLGIIALIGLLVVAGSVVLRRRE